MANTLPSITAGLTPGMYEHHKRMVRSKAARWICLVHIDRCRPDTITDAALLPLLRADYPDMSQRELRRELEYLALSWFLTTARSHDVWTLKITWQGVDIVEYTCECPSGIGRPSTPIE